MNSSNKAIVISVVLTAILFFLFLQMPIGPGAQVTGIFCSGSYCTVHFSDGSSSTGTASQVQGRYYEGGCMLAPGMEGECKRTSLSHEIFGWSIFGI